jgi:outer membrane biosynthesis protein TonB
LQKRVHNKGGAVRPAVSAIALGDGRNPSSNLRSKRCAQELTPVRPELVEGNERKSAPTTLTADTPSASKELGSKKKQKTKKEKKQRALKKKEKKTVAQTAMPEPVVPIKPEKPIEQPAVATPQQAVVPTPQAHAPQESAPADAQDVLYVGQLERDALLVQQEVQQQIEEQWRPPSGLGRNLACKIKVLVDWNGNITDVAVHEKSGVLAFDVSAKTALRAIALPKTAWGKELIFNFQQ